jgi:hypothetical protein
MAAAPVTMSLDNAGRVVLTRLNGRTADVVTLTEDFSARVAAEAVQRGDNPQSWMVAVLGVAEVLPGALYSTWATLRPTIH